jgi:hypothetical protein
MERASMDSVIQKSLWSRVKRAWRKRSLGGFVHLAYRNLIYFAKLPFEPRIVRAQRFDHDFDRQYGTDTTSYVPIGALTVPPENEDNAREYAPSDTSTFRRLLASLSIDHGQFVFIDFGSGKGRTLLLASDYPFKRIIGVEFAEEMHLVALKNISKYKSPAQKCTQLEAVCADATRYQLPDASLVCFFNNPFDDIVFGKWLLNLGRWGETNTHDVYIVYLNCFHRRVFDGSPRWHLLAEGGSTDTGDGFVVYRYVRG